MLNYVLPKPSAQFEYELKTCFVNEWSNYIADFIEDVWRSSSFFFVMQVLCEMFAPCLQPWT